MSVTLARRFAASIALVMTTVVQPAAASAAPSPAVAPIARATDISVGDGAACAVLVDGSLSCWGVGSFGQLGLGPAWVGATLGDDETPADVGSLPLPAGASSTQVSSGAYSCAVLAGGSLSCWGWLFVGSFEQNYISLPAPVALADGELAAHVESSGATCVLLVDGRVKCIGYGWYGNLGNGDQLTRDRFDTAPSVQLPGGLPAIDIAVGDIHSCALLVDGRVSCWGVGNAGQLGFGRPAVVGDDETPASSPTVPMPGGRRATMIAAGAHHTCALLVDGTVTCWGSGEYGGLGYGNVANVGDNETPAEAGVVSLPEGLTATSIAAGRLHTCAVLSDGRVTCWGDGESGVLGYGNVDDVGDDEPPADAGTVAIPQGIGAVEVSTKGFTTCALLVNGRVSCWGSGETLGYGNTATIGDDETPADNAAHGGFVPLPAPSLASTYYSVDPARLADTRPTGSTVDGVGVGGGPLPSNGVLTFGVHGRGGVPADAAAAVLRVTAESPSAKGYLVVATSCDPATRPRASSVNFAAGRAATSTSVVTLDAAGSVCVFTSAPTHVTVDVLAAVPADSPLVTANAARLADSRANGSSVDGQFQRFGALAPASAPTRIQVTGRAGIPVGVSLVWVNLVSVGAASNGYVVAWPCDQPRPRVSSLNLAAGEAVSNVVPAQVDASGGVCVWSSTPSHIIIDAAGFVQQPSTPPSRISPVSARMLDTRPTGTTIDARFSATGPLQQGVTQELPMIRRAFVGSGSSVLVTLTVVQPSADAQLFVWPCDEGRPSLPARSVSAGVTRAVSTMVELSAAGTMCVQSTGSVHLVADLLGIAS